MTRREAVRLILFVRGTLTGEDRTVRCAIVNLSATGAMLSMVEAPPAAPLQLAFELAGEPFDFAVEIERVPPSGGIAVSFARPHSERLHRAIAREQRRALAQGRANISERRLPDAFRPQLERLRQPKGPASGS